MKLSLLLTLALMALPACVGVDARQAEDRGRLDSELVARTGAAPGNAVESEARALLAEPFGPDEAARAALSLAPAVRGLLAALDVATAERVRAGLLRNPLLAFEARTAGDGSDLDLSLTHPLADLFTLGERRGSAALEFEAERARIMRDIVRYMHDVKRAWIDARVAERARAVAGELVEAEAAAARVARQLHAAGNVIDPVLTDIELSLAAAQRAQVLAERGAHEARERLATWIGVDVGGGALQLAEFGIDGALEAVHEPDVVGAALDTSLDLRELGARAEAAAFYRTLRNAVTDHHRRHAAAASRLETLAQALDPEGAEDQELERVICARVGRVAGLLKPEYAEALRRIELEGVPVVEFAREVGISESNAGVRVFRARQALRREVSRSCGTCAEHGCFDSTCS